jgi:antitoxin VapB
MAKRNIAKVFKNGRSQAVRLPREFRVEGTEVRVRKTSEGILLEPVFSNAREWFAAMDRVKGEPLLKDGRNQPRTPRRKIFS